MTNAKVSGKVGVDWWSDPVKLTWKSRFWNGETAVSAYTTATGSPFCAASGGGKPLLGPCRSCGWASGRARRSRMDDVAGMASPSTDVPGRKGCGAAGESANSCRLSW